MPLTLTPFSSTECGFAEWSIDKKGRATLVEIIAYLYLRQEENALRIINALEPRRRAPKGRVAQNVIDKLTAPKQEDVDLLRTGTAKEKASAQHRIDTAISHRDGLLFQHVSWIVARLAFPSGCMTSPHVRQADKGFDGFIIEFDASTNEISRIVLCEDKASIAPRGLIKSSVWEDVASIRRGERDDEILADLVTLLKSVPNIDAESAVDEVFWEEVREFRVAVATGENIRGKSGDFLHIVAGFEAVAGGSFKSRTAGVMPFKDVRVGLNVLAGEVAAKVEEIVSV
jgi:hypothetical protein